MLVIMRQPVFDPVSDTDTTSVFIQPGRDGSKIPWRWVKNFVGGFVQMQIGVDTPGLAQPLHPLLAYARHLSHPLWRLIEHLEDRIPKIGHLPLRQDRAEPRHQPAPQVALNGFRGAGPAGGGMTDRELGTVDRMQRPLALQRDGLSWLDIRKFSNGGDRLGGRLHHGDSMIVLRVIKGKAHHFACQVLWGRSHRPWFCT